MIRITKRRGRNHCPLCKGAGTRYPASAPQRSAPPPLAGQLAWELWDVARQLLNPQERDAVAIHLATREFFYAIRVLLRVVVRADVTVPKDLGARLACWSQTYVGHPDHAVIRDLVKKARTAGRYHAATPEVAAARRRVEATAQVAR
jgi:hypothetical protein